jgi:hypothetical protein
MAVMYSWLLCWEKKLVIVGGLKARVQPMGYPVGGLYEGLVPISISRHTPHSTIVIGTKSVRGWWHRCILLVAAVDKVLDELVELTKIISRTIPESFHLV